MSTVVSSFNELWRMKEPNEKERERDKYLGPLESYA
jgi:hypothetical protein